MSTEKETDLLNSPTKVFYQGEYAVGEKPIIITYYNGTISLDQQDSPKILISEEYLEAFIKSLRKGFQEAEILKQY